MQPLYSGCMFCFAACPKISRHFVLVVCTFLCAPFANAQFSQIAPGVSFLTRTDPGPNRVHALKIDLCTPGVRIKATASADRGARRVLRQIKALQPVKERCGPTLLTVCLEGILLLLKIACSILRRAIH